MSWCPCWSKQSEVKEVKKVVIVDKRIKKLRDEENSVNRKIKADRVNLNTHIGDIDDMVPEVSSKMSTFKL